MLDLISGDKSDIGRNLPDFLDVPGSSDDHWLEGHLLFLREETEREQNEED